MKIAEWSTRFFKFVYFTRHSQVTRPESQSNSSISWMCGPPNFHLMFIFAQMEPKTCGPLGFLFSEKPGGPLVFFSCLICQICCLLWSFLSGHCDVRVVHPHTIITSFVFLSFSTGLSRKAIKGKFYPNISSISSSK